MKAKPSRFERLEIFKRIEATKNFKESVWGFIDAPHLRLVRGVAPEEVHEEPAEVLQRRPGP